MNIKLSDDLREILEYELAHGNEVVEVAFPDDGVVVVLKRWFKILETDATRVPGSVERWDFDDPHYPDASYSGFKSKDSEHILVVKSNPARRSF